MTLSSRDELGRPRAALTLVDLVKNGTLSAEMAALLWMAVTEGVSFLTMAAPRNAGKSTLARAILELRPPGMSLHPVEGDLEQLVGLSRDRLGGYLVVEEINPVPRGAYIWGETVRRVFDTMAAGYSLQASLHAPDARAGMLQIIHQNGVADDLASAVNLVVCLEMKRASWHPDDVTRRVVDIYEVLGVQAGQPFGQSLFRWSESEHHFEKMADPVRFGQRPGEIERRAAAMADLAESGHPADH